MKKFFLTVFILVVFVVLSSLAQDTLMLMTGKRIEAKSVLTEGNYIHYTFNDKYAEKLEKENKKLRSWSIGTGIGLMLPYGEVRQYKTYPFGKGGSDRRSGWNYELIKSVSQYMAIQAIYTSGKLYGEKKDAITTYGGKYFIAYLNELSINAQINLNKLVLQSEYKDESKLNFYAKAGIGFIKYRSVERGMDSAETFINSFGYSNAGLSEEKPLTAMVIPVGLGMRYNLTGNFGLRIETVMKFTDSDKLDADNSNSKKDRFGMTSFGITFTPGRKNIIKDRNIETSDLYYLNRINGKKVTYYTLDTLSNYIIAKTLVHNGIFFTINHGIYNAIIKSMGKYVEGEEFAMKNYKPRIATAGSVFAGLTGGYLAFWGVSLPTIYVIGNSSISPSIKDIDGNLNIPKDRLNDRFFIQGYKDKARRIDLKRSVIGSIAGLTAMIIIKSIHSSFKNF